MPDAFAHCAALVRTADRDRYLASLFAPESRRGALCALHAFNIEVERVGDAARQPIAGEIRLQWWREVVAGERAGEARANPVAAALLAAMERHDLPASTLAAFIEAHRFDVYDAPFAATAELETYLAKTSSAVIALATRILGCESEAAAQPAGLAQGITDLLRALPQHAARGRLYVPVDLLTRHGVMPHDVAAGRASPGLGAALADLRGLASSRLEAAHRQIMALRPEALPAFLPLAVVRPALARLERSEPFAPAELPLWRRQWLIWRAARNPARIAG